MRELRPALRLGIHPWSDALRARRRYGGGMANGCRRRHVDVADLAEQTRQAEARRRAAEEHLRMARELHDLLSHTISVINVQAGAAAHLLRERPDEAEQALRIIRTTSQEALRELGSMLGMLGQGTQAREPVQGLAQLAALVTNAAERAADGLPSTDGAP